MRLFFSDINRIYKAPIVISILIILLSYVPYGIAGAETILVSIGCSGIAAGIMAIFIDIAQKKQEEKRIMQLKKYNLDGLHQELKLFWERLIWFDEVLSSQAFDNDLYYYLSLDFVRKATSWGVYRQENYEEMCSDIEQLVDKYDKKNWKESKGVTYEKVEKMFYIISNTSINIQKEMSALNRNRSFLVANDIISIEEITELNTCVGKHIEFLGEKGTNYGASLYFLFEAYRKIKNIGSYDDEICIITWHQKGDIVDLVLEDRKKK